MGTNDSSFAARLFQARLAYSAEKGRQVTQAELAELADVSPAAWSTWEAGRSEPPLDTIGKVAKVLGVDPGWLAFGPQEVPAPRPAGKGRARRARPEGRRGRGRGARPNRVDPPSARHPDPPLAPEGT